MISSYEFRLKETGELQNKSASLISFESCLENISQVVHDIRSPLAAMEMLLGHLPELDEDKRQVLKNSVKRIKEITNSLSVMGRAKPMTLMMEANPSERNAFNANVVLLDSLIDALVSEKRIQHHNRPEIEIDYQRESSVYGAFVKVNPGEFNRVLSNLIDNGIEAIPSRRSGKVQIQTKLGMNGKILITLSDNGKGMAPEVLQKVGKKGLSIDKLGGSGLGLHHAKKMIKSWNGELNIDSEKEVGTTLTLSLDLQPQEEWFAKKITVHEFTTVVVIDQDLQMHEFWKMRIHEQGKFKNAIHCFARLEEFTQYYAASFHEWISALYIVNDEIFDKPEKTFEWLNRLGISKQSLVISNQLESTRVLDYCTSRGIKLLSKYSCEFVPIAKEE